jgi:hypothetical protein
VSGRPVDDMYEAARLMRAQHGDGHPRQQFWSALSRWMHEEARRSDGAPDGIDEVYSLPLTAARAYLDATAVKP